MVEIKSSKMDLSELAKIVVDRIQKLDPGNVSKIMGFILLKEPCEQEMMKLAFGSEDVLLRKIDEAKTILGFLSPNNFSVSSQNHSLQNLGFTPQAYPDSFREDYTLCKQSQIFNLEEKMESSSSVGNHYCYQDSSFNGSLSSRTSRRSPSLLEFPVKVCHYFNKGFCKHGENCRYFHGHYQAFGSHLNEFQGEENGFFPESLGKLEMEIAELLKSRRGAPVSISLLITLYYEKYGRILRADGYLTKLLACFNNSIRLINRPRGQHSIILTEDAPKYLECRHERNEQGTTSAGSHQIYLTFPADSTFSEDDISSYFKQFGPVKDVRIPCQEKRMYGFVSFLYPETVCNLLMKKNAHYIGGSRVLVKPYKEKSRMVDRSYIGKNKLSMHHPYQYLDLDSELFGIPRKADSSRMIKLYLMEQQKMIESERSRLARFNLVQEHQQSYNNYGVDDPKLLEVADSNHFEEDHLGFTHDVLNTGLSSHVKTRNTSNNYSNKESDYFELPENPFGSPPSVGSSLKH